MVRTSSAAAGAVAVLFAAFLGTPVARAQPQPPVQAVEPPPPLSYWQPGKPRLFVQTRLDVGVNFGKATVSAGYGLPHWIWVGVEGFAISTTEFGAYYGGVRASTPILDLAFGYRNNYAYRRTFLVPKEEHSADDTRVDGQPHSRYLAWEIEASGLVPLFGGYAIWMADFDKIIDAPPGVHIYEESNRVVVDPPWVIGLRGGYLYPFLKKGILKIGAVADYVILPHRPGNVLRVGPVGLLAVTDHLEILGLATLAVKSPDDLGFFLGTWAVACVRYKWATGEISPHFP